MREQQIYISEGLLKEEVTLPPEGCGAAWLAPSGQHWHKGEETWGVHSAATRVLLFHSVSPKGVCSDVERE